MSGAGTGGNIMREGWKNGLNGSKEGMKDKSENW